MSPALMSPALNLQRVSPSDRALPLGRGTIVWMQPKSASRFTKEIILTPFLAPFSCSEGMRG